MIYEILSTSGAVVNRINADEDFVRAAYPGRWRLEAAAPVVDPGAEQPAPTVPESVPMLNAHLAIIQAGKMGTLTDLIAALPEQDQQEADAYLNLAQNCRRDNKWVNQLGPALGWDSVALDQLFITAAALNP